MTSSLVREAHHRQTVPGKRRSLAIKAELKFIYADDAKTLVADEGYAIVDVRDKTQFERAHIQQCYHVPLFIKNKDNDFGTMLHSVASLFSCYNLCFYLMLLLECRYDYKEDAAQQFCGIVLRVAIHKN